MDPITPRYGRYLEEFTVGATYRHPWEVTVSDGVVALFQASFLDAMPIFASDARARSLGLSARPLHPHLLLNLALSFSVHDVSEQAIAHLAYVDVRFPEPAFPGETVSARSTVLEVKPSASGDKGVVHVRTALQTVDGRNVCVFERKALIRTRPAGAPPLTCVEEQAFPVEPLDGMKECPEPVARARKDGPKPPGGPLAGYFEDFSVGQVWAHPLGKTVGESEHMQLTTLFRNSHPLHFDAVYSTGSSFTKERVVYGGLVFSWIGALASRDVAGNALWILDYKAGAHPASVAAGDTLYAISRVISVEDRGLHTGAVGFELVGVKNMTSRAALERYGEALFQPELGKKDNKIPEKVFETRRTLLVKKAPNR